MKHIKEAVILFLTLAVICLTAFAAFGGGKENPISAQHIHLGLDLAGGVTITYQAKEGSDPSSEEMNGALAVIRHRLDNKGYTEANAYLEGTDRIRVEIPGVEDASEAVEEIGRTAMLQFVGIDYEAIIRSDYIEEFYQRYLEDVRAAAGSESSESTPLSDVEEGMSVLDITTLSDEEILADAKNYFTNYFPDAIMRYPELLERSIEEGLAEIVVTGTNVSNATYQRGQVGNGVIESYVKLEFDAEGTKLFAEGTQKYYQKYIAIMLDDTMINMPSVGAVISDGVAVIQGIGSEEEAKSLADDIVGGALPVELEDIEHKNIGATLGISALNTSIRAGIIGFIIIIIFMILFYRVPGVCASLALVFYVSCELLLIKALGWTLTLSGIAGFILSIGMAVDANIIIFSRIREEMLLNRTIRVAAKNGFKLALTAILDGNITTLIAAIVLYFFGSGTIKGFAQTLGLGIVLSMFSALIVTRILLTSSLSFLPDTPALYCIRKINLRKEAKA